ncbi:MAG: hypothetical protein ACRDJ3_04935 [Solirubrobacteraceae bacterium]
MTWPRRSATVTLVLVLAVIVPSGASADVGTTIDERCANHQPLAGYTLADYRRALQEMEASADQYSECFELISNAELAAVTGAGPGAGPGAAVAAGPGVSVITPTLVESRAVKQAAYSSPAALHLGGHVVLPGVVHVTIASAASKLPASLLAMLAFLLTGGTVAAGRTVKSHIARSRQR